MGDAMPNGELRESRCKNQKKIRSHQNREELDEASIVVLFTVPADKVGCDDEPQNVSTCWTKDHRQTTRQIAEPRQARCTTNQIKNLAQGTVTASKNHASQKHHKCLACDGDWREGKWNANLRRESCETGDDEAQQDFLSDAEGGDAREKTVFGKCGAEHGYDFTLSLTLSPQGRGELNQEFRSNFICNIFKIKPEVKAFDLPGLEVGFRLQT